MKQLALPVLASSILALAASGCGSEKPWGVDGGVYGGPGRNCRAALSRDSTEMRTICRVRKTGLLVCQKDALDLDTFDSECKAARRAMERAGRLP